MSNSPQSPVELSVNVIQQPGQWRSGALLLLGLALGVGTSSAASPANQPIFTAISVSGGNLVFNVAIPAGVNRAILEMRSALEAPWQEAALTDIPAVGGHFELTIPKPALDTAFFRLRAITLATRSSRLSTELEYVAMPPLGSASTNALAQDAVLHFKGVVDGSDRILITREGAFWEHVSWNWPAKPVTVNGNSWNPREKNYLTSTGAVAFLPEPYSLALAHLDVIQGRDVVALERTHGALIVYLDDTPKGAATYEFRIHFHPAPTRPSALAMSPTATLKVAAQIDGSDTLKVTARDAVWTHRTHAYPKAIRLNGIPWDVRQTNTLMNTGTNTFLPADVDLSTARIIHRKGRDLGTIWADADALWIRFADNPNGTDAYELEISFGPQTGK